MKLSHVYHLYRRAGFGITPEAANKLVGKERRDVVEALIDASSEPTPLTIDLSIFDEFFRNNPNPKFEQFKPLIKETRELHFDLNKAWLERLFAPKEALNERMTLFWANVFVCKDNVVPNVQQFNNTLRTHALGNFKKFTKAVSREPAMIKYLNTNKNRKNHPNENFARELMELFTLGEGHYSEQDIKEVARAFTGYSFRFNGQFKLNEYQHDYGEKEFMGWKANLDGDDVIDIICQQRRCAEFICTKLFTYFVNAVPNEQYITELTDVFYNNYEIKEVMRHMLSADWFYDEEHIGSKIKSPIDLLTSIHRVVPYKFTKDKQHLFVQEIMGQTLLSPPNVAGWKGGRAWINTNTMLVRLKLPSVFLGNGLVPASRFSARFNGGKFADRLAVRKRWKNFDQQYGDLSTKELVDALCPKGLEPGTLRILNRTDHLSQRELGIQIMSTPEFQLT